jgi:prolyl 4-hydroxylase
MITTLSPDWREWIQVNLERNCSVSSMVEAMVAKDFDPNSAAAFIATVAAETKHRPKQERRPENSPGAYKYESSRLPVTKLLHSRDRVASVRMRLRQPEILLLEGVLSEEECNELIHRAQLKLNPSTTVDPTTGENKVIQNRTSFGTYFHLEEDEFIARLDQRLSEIANWPLDHAEGLQILNYHVGGEYKPHFDFFPPEEGGSSVHTAQGGQRVATIVMYLNDVEEGGETIFPKLSLSIAPRKGDAVYFSYCNSLGQVDRLTLHGGAPVLKGEKWIATKWMRQHRRR